MKNKTYLLTAATIFSIVSITHLLRAVYGWDLIVKEWMAPIKLSILAFLITGYLAYEGFKLSKKH